MSNEFSPKSSLYLVQVMDAQAEALERIGRTLTADELHAVKKGLQAGLGAAQSIVMRTAIEEAVGDPDIEHSTPLSIDSRFSKFVR